MLIIFVYEHFISVSVTFQRGHGLPVPGHSGSDRHSPETKATFSFKTGRTSDALMPSVLNEPEERGEGNVQRLIPLSDQHSYKREREDAHIMITWSVCRGQKKKKEKLTSLSSLSVHLFIRLSCYEISLSLSPSLTSLPLSVENKPKCPRPAVTV